MNYTKPFHRVVALSLLGIGLIFGAAPSDAFRMIQNTATGRVTSGNLVTCDAVGGFTHWTTDAVSWRHNTAGQGSNKASALQSAMASWTNVVDANHTLTYAGTTTAGWQTDSTNTILWAVGNGCTNNCLALTALVLQSGQEIVESDITFNENVSWNTNGTDFDTEAIAAHELGHSLGIHHTELTTTPRPTMYFAHFGTGGRSLHSDDIAALQCSQDEYPVGPITKTFTSIASEDGRIIESTETSGVGGTVDSTAAGGGALRIGDTGADKQHRSILSFGTGPIPDGATIQSATLQLRRGAASGTNPFTTHNPCRVDIKTGTFAGGSLVASDFQAAATAVNVATLTNPTTNGALSNGTLKSTGRNAINKTGRTQFRIYCNLDDNDDLGQDYIGFYAAENATEFTARC